jgi:hypothetical protein
MALPLPFILLAIDYYLQGKLSWKEVFRKSLFFILAIYFGWLTLKAAHYVVVGYVPYFLAHHIPFIERLDLSSEAIWMYVQKFFIPYPLSCYYPVIYYLHGPLFLYSMMTVGVLLFFAVFRRNISLRLSCLGLAWFLLTIAPFLNIYGVNESIIYDRYFYIPSIGILLMLIGVWEGSGLGKMAKVAGSIWFVFIITLSSWQMGIWQDMD